MVRKEDVYGWFSTLLPHQRIEFVCGLMQLLLPPELRFFGACLEDLARKDYAALRDAEVRANTLVEVQPLANLLNDEVRSRLVFALTLLHSTNIQCATALYDILMKKAGFARVLVANDQQCCEDILLIYTLAINHPAFIFDQRQNLYAQLQSLVRCREETAPSVDIVNNSCSQQAEESSSPAWIESIAVREVERPCSCPERCIYTLEVMWSNQSVTEVRKSYSEIMSFLSELGDSWTKGLETMDDAYPTDNGSVAHLERCFRSLLSQRQQNLDDQSVREFFGVTSASAEPQLDRRLIESDRQRQAEVPVDSYRHTSSQTISGADSGLSSDEQQQHRAPAPPTTAVSAKPTTADLIQQSNGYLYPIPTMMPPGFMFPHLPLPGQFRHLLHDPSLTLAHFQQPPVLDMTYPPGLGPPSSTTSPEPMNGDESASPAVLPSNRVPYRRQGVVFRRKVGDARLCQSGVDHLRQTQAQTDGNQQQLSSPVISSSLSPASSVGSIAEGSRASSPPEIGSGAQVNLASTAHIPATHHPGPSSMEEEPDHQATITMTTAASLTESSTPVPNAMTMPLYTPVHFTPPGLTYLPMPPAPYFPVRNNALPFPPTPACSVVPCAAAGGGVRTGQQSCLQCLLSYHQMITAGAPVWQQPPSQAPVGPCNNANTNGTNSTPFPHSLPPRGPVYSAPRHQIKKLNAVKQHYPSHFISVGLPPRAFAYRGAGMVPMYAGPPPFRAAVQPTCHNCGLPGHRFTECPQQRIDQILGEGMFQLNFVPQQASTTTTPTPTSNPTMTSVYNSHK